MSYVIVDIETTGLSKNYHKITEIAAVYMEEGKIRKEFSSLVNPETRIPNFITRLTGISDEMVKDAPKIAKVMPEFIDFLGQNSLVAHNASFDYGFLNFNQNLLTNQSIRNNVICTKKLANRLLPDLPSKRLSSICEHFAISNLQAHRAMADVKATAEVFNNFIQMLDKRGFTTPNDIYKFQKIPRRMLLESNSKPRQEE